MGVITKPDRSGLHMFRQLSVQYNSVKALATLVYTTADKLNNSYIVFSIEFDE